MVCTYKKGISSMKKLFVGFVVASAAACVCVGADLKPFPTFAPPRAVTKGPYDHFLANYFAINAWSPDNRYLLVLETAIQDKLPDGTPCMLGLTDLEDNNRFIPIMPIRTWNFQSFLTQELLPRTIGYQKSMMKRLNKLIVTLIFIFTTYQCLLVTALVGV